MQNDGLKLICYNIPDNLSQTQVNGLFETLSNNAITLNIANADCLVAMREIADESVDLVVTSPPYNCGIRYDNWNDRMRWDDYYRWTEEWMGELYRVLRRDGRACIVHYLSMGSGERGYRIGVLQGTEEDIEEPVTRHTPLLDINRIAQDIGFKHHGIALWWDLSLSKKTAWGSWLSASAPYINSPLEAILIIYKERWKKERDGKTEISKSEFIEGCRGIWKIMPEQDRQSHPAPFPVKLAERCIRLLSWEGDVVLDPFAGNFTTGVACINAKRNFIGIEISPQYYASGKKRLQSVLSQYRLFELSGDK